MRKFRNAALAAATATAVALGGTTVAVAQEDSAPKSNSSQTSFHHVIGRDIFKIDTKKPSTNEATGQQIFGEKTWTQEQFGWKLLYGTTWAMGAFALFTFLIAPIYNHFKFGPGA